MSKQILFHLEYKPLKFLKRSFKLNLFGSPIHTALSHIEVKSFVNYLFIKILRHEQGE